MTSSLDTTDIAASYVNSTNKHVFLTGRAGTGKTTFLRDIVKKTYKSCVVAAPTGIAAINAGGVTLHSLLQLPFGSFVPEDRSFQELSFQVNTPNSLARGQRFNAQKRQLLRELDLLIIDEVSMLRADLLDCIDHTLRNVRRKRHLAFGGLQVLFIGDLLQLPPVVKDDEWNLLKNYYSTPYFFDAKVLKNEQPIRLELSKIYRQSDEKFIALLNRLRDNEQNEFDFEDLNQYFEEGVEQMERPGYIHLTTHNKKADHINQTRLNQLPGIERKYIAEIDGDFPETMFPTSYALSLKEGTQVMFIKNDASPEKQFFNGKIGEIVRVSEPPIVRFETGDEIEVPLYKWENKRYVLDKDTNEVVEKYQGGFQQYPLKLAWAVTIHKSQGLTFEKAILDLAGTFAPGQLYVALSRLTSVNGLILSSPLPGNPPGFDDSLKQFTETFESEKELESGLKDAQIDFLKESAQITFSFEDLVRQMNYHLGSFNKSANRSEKQQFLEWTRDIRKEVLELQKIANQFQAQLQSILYAPEVDLTFLSDRMLKAREYFKKEFEQLISKVKDHLKEIGKKKKVKGYTDEVKDMIVWLDFQLRQILKTSTLAVETAQNREVTKETLKTVGYFHSSLPKKVSRKDKKPTAEISLELYQQGKLPKEIAEYRGLVESTIVGHLASYVETGEIEPQHLVPENKLRKIVDQIKEGLERSSEIKEKLGDGISYSEIKVGMAYAKWLEENGQLNSE